MDALSGNVRTILDAAPEETLGSPRLSTDGKALLVEVVMAGEPSLRVFPAVGGKATAEISNAGGGSWIDPDSFLFTREVVEGGFGLYRYSLSSRETTSLRDVDDSHPWGRAEPRPGRGFALLTGTGGDSQQSLCARQDQRPAGAVVAPGQADLRSVVGAVRAVDGRFGRRPPGADDF